MRDEVGPTMYSNAQSTQTWNAFDTELCQTTNQVALKLMQQTTVTVNEQQQMQVVFPRHRSRGSFYIGGAHGTLGVLYMIVMACLLDDKSAQMEQEAVLRNIVMTCEDLLSMQDESGGFPTVRPDPGMENG